MTRSEAEHLPLIELADLLSENHEGFEGQDPQDIVNAGLDRSDALNYLDDVDFFEEE